MMTDDPIISEVRKARKEILKSYNWNFEAMMRDMMKRQYQHGRRVISHKKKNPQQGIASNAYPPRPQMQIKIVADENELANSVIDLWQNEDQAKEMVKNGQKYIRSQQGATQTNVNTVLKILI